MQVGRFLMMASVGVLGVAPVAFAQASDKSENIEYRVLATSKTSTMEKELSDTGTLGFEVVGMTVGKAAIGGDELVTILRRRTR